MLYYQAKCDCKQTSSLEDTAKNSFCFFYYISLRCDLDMEDSEPIFPHDTLPYKNTPPYQVWFKKKEEERNG